MAILALRAGTGWTMEETARRFQVTPMTLQNWMRRLDETKESGLLALPAPVNKYPDFVEVLVKQLGRVAPLIGKKRIADVLARAGLHLAPTTVARLRARKGPEPKPPSAGATGEAAAAQSAAAEAPSAKWVTSKRPHHVWNLDFTLLPTTPGWWVPWVPWSLLQRWPFCFWLGVVMDHYSRSVVAWKLFRKQPTAAETCALLSAATLAAATPPKHLITDAGSQFRDEYQAWCAALGVRPRRGAVGKSGSIAVIERFFRSLKAEMLARLKLTPANAARLGEEISAYLTWYHDHRPHQGLGGLTPRECLRGGVPARKRQRREPRAHYPLARGSPGGLPRRAARLELVCDTVEGRPHLPIVKLRAAA
jgi:putative transposase